MAPSKKLKAEDLPAIIERKENTDLIVEEATYWANRLMDVVDRCGLSKNMAGKKYLEVEGWLLIAEFAHCRPVIEWVKPWLDGEGKIVGYEARCQLLNDHGQTIGAGESSCGLDAFPTRGKQGLEKDKAAKSAAQTWAISRALRNKFSYVAKIAGYQAVPAEEMHEEAPPIHDSREDLITTPVSNEPRITAGQLGVAIMNHVNNDSKAAQEILKKLTGKTTLSGMKPDEAREVYKQFEAQFLHSAPDADNIPETWPDTPK